MYGQELAIQKRIAAVHNCSTRSVSERSNPGPLNGPGGPPSRSVRHSHPCTHHGIVSPPPDEPGRPGANVYSSSPTCNNRLRSHCSPARSPLHHDTARCRCSSPHCRCCLLISCAIFSSLACPFLRLVVLFSCPGTVSCPSMATAPFAAPPQLVDRVNVVACHT